MNLDDLKSQVALGEDSRRQFKRDRIEIVSPGHLPNNLTVAKIRAGNSIIRNPILVSYIAKGLLPYRGLGSGIKRALEDWPEIEFLDDRVANLFTAMVHRNESIGALEPEMISQTSVAKGKSSQKSSQKSSRKIMDLMRTDPAITIADLVQNIGITDRAIKKQIEKLKAQGRIRRIGPDKGGHWEVVE